MYYSFLQLKYLFKQVVYKSLIENKKDLELEVNELLDHHQIARSRESHWGEVRFVSPGNR